MQAKEVVDQVTMKRALTRITYEIIERNQTIQDVVLIGIKTRGIYIASRVADRLKQLEGIEVPVGELDITLYRDDKKETPAEAELHSSDIPVSLEGKEVILIDDVLYTGRTIRADYVGKNIPTAKTEEILVEMQELDGKDRIMILKEEE